MGKPEMNITFKKLSETAILRSGRGIACLIVKDTKIAGVHTYSYNKRNYIKETYDETNLSLIKEGFNKYGVNKIVVYGITGDDTLTNALVALKKVEINYLACNYELQKADIDELKAFQFKRSQINMDVIVVATAEADNKEFINFVPTGVKVNEELVEPHRMNCKLALIQSACPMTKSTTYFVLNDVTACDDVADEDAFTDAGKMFIIYDGEKYKLSRAVNSMKTLGEEDKESMKKIKVVEGSILVKGDIYKVFSENYCGKNNNDFRHRTGFVSDINRYLNDLVLEGVLNENANNYVELDVGAMRVYMEEQGHDTTKMSDNDVLIDKDGHCGSKLFLTGNVRFVDAMEDFDLIMYY